MKEKKSHPDSAQKEVEEPKRLVGIGASAGGLESLEQFFGSVPAGTGLAFVVVQHLSPDHRSMMDELLSRHSHIPIRVAQHGDEIRANYIYLLPPRKEIVVREGRLLLTDKDPLQSLTLPIDKFFRSLATEFGQRAVAVVLSGTGSDGSRGVREVKRMSGTVLVEDPQTAKFDGMPLSAIATNRVDYVAPASQLPARIIEGAPAPKQVETPTAEESPMERVLRLLREHSSIDFSFYKTTTVTRRIERRVAMKDLESLEAYVQRLEVDSDELNSLYHDLLIGVTQFFRDPECFEVLAERIVPELIEATSPEEELRVWVAGCATGEEAYSVAMILYEALTEAERPVNVKILATDVHASSLDVAARGFYGQEQLLHVSEQRRSRFFTKRSGGYQVSQDLRRLIVFAPHNVTKDAPFTKMHLITCRNLLIYLEPQAQHSVLSLFHFGLAQNGTLFLGSSESVGGLANEFLTLDEHCKFFRKRRDVRLLDPRALSLPKHSGGRGATLPVRSLPRPDSRLLPIYDRLLDRWMPPSFLVDEEGRLIDKFAGAERWLRVNRRRPTDRLLDLMDGELRTITAGALQQAAKSNNPVRFTEISLSDPDGNPCRYTLRAEPLPGTGAGGAPTLITLVPNAGDGVVDSSPPDSAHDLELQASSDERVQTLEGELSYARETLQATVEELQTSNEQLQATNEELVASNEELQSTNEELHSVNEELYTVNAEHQKRIADLRELNADMQHLLEGTDIATLFLDEELCIRKYTPRIAGIFHIKAQDVGRSIRDFSHDLKRPALMQEIEATLKRGTLVEDEVKDTSGGSYFLRVLPYRTAEKGQLDEAVREDPTDTVPIAGVVLTLTDIGALDRARARLAQLSAIVESSDDAIIGTARDGTITSWNRGAVRLYGFSTEEAMGQHLTVLAPPDKESQLLSFVEAATSGQSVERAETVHRHKNGRSIHVSVTLSPILDQEGTVVGASAISRDVSALKLAQQELQQRSERIKLLLNSTAEAIFGLAPDGKCTFSNLACARMLGFATAEELIGVHLHSLIHPLAADGSPCAEAQCPIYGVLSSGQGTHSDNERLARTDGTTFQTEHWSHPIRQNGEVVGAVVTFLDITDRKQAEAEIRRAAERREQFLAMLSHELRNPLSAVLNATHVMRAEKANEQVVAKARGVIDRQAKHMACLLEDLLDVSRIARGGIQLKKEPVDLRTSVRMAVEALSPALKKHQADLTLDLPEEALMVEGDGARLQQVVANLLSNAVRYSPRGTPIHVSAVADGHSARLLVRDEGAGIDPDLLPQIFDLFYQNKQGLDRAKGGLGIGLTLVRKIVELHGGQVRAESQGVGKGSQFTVELPRAIGVKEPISTNPGPAQDPCCVLVVEDQRDARDMLRLLLEARGNRVLVATDGASALHMLEQELPDVALVDIGLPTMSGYELARRARSASRTKDVRLVALTGYGTTQDVEAAREAGFDDHLTKPADPESLARVLRR